MSNTWIDSDCNILVCNELEPSETSPRVRVICV